MLLAGIDGCKSGWIVIWDHDGATSVDCFQDFSETLKRRPSAVVIDIPIGLLNVGTREADHKARQLLKNRGCCVFTAPTRTMLECTTYELAKACRMNAEAKGLTKQAWAIFPKIREVDQTINPTLQQIVKEGHPEISFAIMNGGKPIQESKHSLIGQQARIALLRHHFPEIELRVSQNRGLREDVIDAYAMLWTARRLHQGNATAIPENSTVDASGLFMQIWA